MPERPIHSGLSGVPKVHIYGHMDTKAELRAEIEAAEGDEKAELEAELAKDPLAADVGDGFGAGRLAFGPFLVLGILEYMLFGQWAADQYLNVLWL